MKNLKDKFYNLVYLQQQNKRYVRHRWRRVSFYHVYCINAFGSDKTMMALPWGTINSAKKYYFDIKVKSKGAEANGLDTKSVRYDWKHKLSNYQSQRRFDGRFSCTSYQN
jgi:hypothetical protein